MKFKAYLELKRKEYESLSEELKIIKKNWAFKVPGYTIEVNDEIKHSLLQRTKLRTDASLNTVKKDIQRGLEFLGKQVKAGTIKNRDMNSLIFKKSDFKVLVLLNPDEHYMRVSTIMNPEMPTKKDTKWTLKEFTEQFWDVQVEPLETFAFDCDIDEDIDHNGCTFLVEPCLMSEGHEVFQQINIKEFVLN